MITLFEHQKDALNQTKLHNRVAYYLDMGLGKTFVGSEKMMELDSNVNLVVCQKSKVDDWIEHFRKYYLKYNDKVLNQTFNLTNKAEFTQFFYAMNMTKFGQTIGVINYDLIFRRPELAKLKDFTLMLDESSLVQNEMSKRSKFILNKLNPTNVILLSGTPTGGKYERLWSQCKLLGWKISKDAFWKTYVDYHYDDKDGFPLKVIDGYKNVERLKRKFREHGAIFMKSEEVFDLPAQCNNNIFVSTTKEYRKFRKDSIVKFNDHEFVGDSVLTKMLYERMLCGFANDQKLDALQDLFDSTDDRIIIFYNFQNELRVLSELVYDNERPLSIINGDTKDLSAYDNSEDSVTLIQYQAGAMGLNLQKANKIIYFTPPLSSELFEQSKKRIHRIGQERSCFYYYLTCKGSIEEKIYRTLAMRKDYTDKLFERGE
jgi:SNF2 family DNA or RNA helicase